MPIIVLSGLDDESIAVRAVRQGAQDYLVKGQVDGALLVRAIRYAIERKHTEERERALTEAKLAVRVRDDFLAATSHDLKNPLAAIKGTTQLLLRTLERNGSVSPDRLAAALSNISGSVNQLTALLDELLDIARLRSGEPLKLEYSPTDLVALARQAVTAYQETTDQHQFQIHSSEPAVIGEWDAGRLERVLANLLSNAIKYSPQGGEIRVRVGRTRAALRGECDWAVLSVQDRGIGIPAADLPHIFNGFERGTNVIGRIRGTGIGLAICRQIVEQHGGMITVESHEGAGSTFLVKLPLAPDTAPAIQQSQRQSNQAPVGMLSRFGSDYVEPRLA